MNLSRRDFISLSTALLVCGPAFGKTLDKKAHSRSMVFNASLGEDSYFIKLNPTTSVVTKVKANCWPHAFTEDKNIYYGVEKKGYWLTSVDFENPSQLKKIKAPKGMMFYGHCAISGNNLIVTAIKFDEEAGDDFKTFNANTSPGYLLVYDKKTLVLKDTIGDFGFGPHEIINHKGQLIVALYQSKNGLSSILTFDPQSMKLLKENYIPQKYKHLKFRHFVQEQDKIFIILNAFEGKMGTNLAVGAFDRAGTLNITDYSNAKEKHLDYDHTTAFYHNGELYVVMFLINRMLVFNKTGRFVDLGPNDLGQLKVLSNLLMHDREGFIMKDKEFQNKKLTIKSHIYISS